MQPEFTVCRKNIEQKAVEASLRLAGGMMVRHKDNALYSARALRFLAAEPVVRI